MWTKYIYIHHAYDARATSLNAPATQGKPFRFKLGSEQVVPGLDEGVSQLSIGERAKVTMPPGLAYGAKGFPGLVPPNSSLVFDMELLGIADP
jgi:FKBP-type peptidyl-prolyl cis-trans isomerase